jgi:hypothetical protein
MNWSSSVSRSMYPPLRSCLCLDSGHKRSGGLISDLWVSSLRPSPLPATWRCISGSPKSGDRSETWPIADRTCSSRPPLLFLHTGCPSNCFISRIMCYYLFVSCPVPLSPYDKSNLPRLNVNLTSPINAMTGNRSTVNSALSLGVWMLIEWVARRCGTRRWETN